MKSCLNCGKLFQGRRETSKYCSRKCTQAHLPIMQKGRTFNSTVIQKMIETRKKTGNYGWTEERKICQSERLKGIPFTSEHKKKISNALKGKKFSIKHRQNIHKAKNKRISNSIQHQKEIERNIQNFKNDGFFCIRVDKCPLPDFIAIKDNKAYAIEIEGGHMNFAKYFKPHDYADIIWIQFRRIKDGKM